LGAIVDKKRKIEITKITFTKFGRIFTERTNKNEFRVWSNSIKSDEKYRIL